MFSKNSDYRITDVPHYTKHEEKMFPEMQNRIEPFHQVLDSYSKNGQLNSVKGNPHLFFKLTCTAALYFS